MIPITMKRQMVVLLGQVIRDEGDEINWDNLTFDEKMKLADSVLYFAVSKIKCGWDFNIMGKELRRLQ